HHRDRRVVMWQAGTAPYRVDCFEEKPGYEIGEQALRTWTDWQLVDQIGMVEFIPGTSGYRDGFINQQNIAMMIDGSFAIGQVENGAQFEWGVAELPTFDDGTKSNYGSF